MKIIQLNSSSILGGGQQIMFSIVDRLKTDFDFIVIAPPGAFLDKYREKNIFIEELGEVGLISIIKKIKRLIKKHQPDIIHAHGTRAAFWLRAVLISLKRWFYPQLNYSLRSGRSRYIKIIYTLHGFHIIRKNFLIRWLYLIIERFLNKWVDILVCVSEADQNLVLKHKTISENKIVVIKNGIDLKRFQISQQEVEDIKQNLELRNNFILTTIGRLHQPKDYFTILRALKILISWIKNIKLLIIGDGPLRESLEKGVKNLGLKKYVKFLGFWEDIPVLINLSDIIILSTKWEGLPLVPLETGACKKPIIASDVEGVRETILDKKTGYLFKSGSEKDLSEKILEVYQSEKLRKNLGENAFKFVSENFDIKVMAEKYEKLYQTQMVSLRGRPLGPTEAIPWFCQDLTGLLRRPAPFRKDAGLLAMTEKKILR